MDKDVFELRFGFDRCDPQGELERLHLVILATGSLDWLVSVGLVLILDPNLDRSIRSTIPERLGGYSSERDDERRMRHLQRRVCRERGSEYLRELKSRLVAAVTTNRDDDEAAE